MKTAGTVALKHLWQYAAAEAVPKGVFFAWIINSVYRPAKTNSRIFTQGETFSPSFLCTGTNHKFISKGIQTQTFNISVGKINYDVCSSWQMQHAKGAWRYAILIMRYYCEVLLSF